MRSSSISSELSVKYQQRLASSPCGQPDDVLRSGLEEGCRDDICQCECRPLALCAVEANAVGRALRSNRQNAAS